MGIPEQEWHAVQMLAAEEKGWVPDTVLKIRKNLVEIRFRALDDVRDINGGITRRYEKKATGWTKTNFSGSWNYVLLP